MTLIRVGTDCSGIEAPIQALHQLNIPFTHEFACEIDKFARKSIEANYSPKKMYTDMTKRDHSKLPDIDLYVCGFPCQPFSNMGKKQGTNDPRGYIMLHCVEVIKTKLPKYFILENVKNFKTIQGGEPYNFLINELNKDGKYNVYVDLLNTKHYGIPQNRERVFIIGIRKDICTNEYQTPKKKPMKPLDSFIEDKTVYDRDSVRPSLQKNIERFKDIKNNYIILSNTYCSAIRDMCPTIVTGCNGTYYHKLYNRYLTPKELLNLQGFGKFNQVVSNTQFSKQIGNSMSVNVLMVILQEMINASSSS